MKISVILSIVLILAYSYAIDNDDLYNESLGQQFLMYSKISYCPQDQIQNWTCESCLDSIEMKDIRVIVNHPYKAQAYVGYDKGQNRIVIAFRGSHNIRNWMSDLHYERHKYPYCHKCLVHSGFYNVWGSIEGYIFAHYNLLKKKYPNAEVIITGHSLGGAVATLAAVEFIHRGYKVDRVLVFASPRCGNKRFAEYASAKLPQYVVVTHHRDPVPHMPSLIQGFRRLPSEVYYKYTKGLFWEWCPSEAPHENPHCSDYYDVFLGFSQHTTYLDQYTGCGSEEVYTDSIDQDLIEENRIFEKHYFENQEFYDNLIQEEEDKFFQDQEVNGDSQSKYY